jgi:hypothetical protein
MAAPAVGMDPAAITISAIWIVEVRLYDRCLVVLSMRLARNDLENSNETLVPLRDSRDTLARWSGKYLSVCRETRLPQFGSLGAKVPTTS